jgi:hypothetical protein
LAWSDVFFRCSVSKAIWFGQGSGSLLEFFPISSSLDIIKLIIDPPIPACDPSDRKSLLLQAATQIALSIDYIWSFKNQVVHSVKQGNIVSLCKGLDIRILEHLQAANQIASPEPCRDAVWTAPCSEPDQT